MKRHLKAHTLCRTVLSAVQRGPAEGFLTYEGAPFGVEFSGHADIGAQVQHDEHGGDHDDALQEQQGLEVAAESDGGKTGECVNFLCNT